MLRAMFHGVQDRLIDQLLDGRAISGKVYWIQENLAGEVELLHERETAGTLENYRNVAAEVLLLLVGKLLTP